LREIERDGHLLDKPTDKKDPDAIDSIDAMENS
jgi:hypothetical protein